MQHRILKRRREDFTHCKLYAGYSSELEAYKTLSINSVFYVHLVIVRLLMAPCVPLITDRTIADHSEQQLLSTFSCRMRQGRIFSNRC